VWVNNRDKERTKGKKRAINQWNSQRKPLDSSTHVRQEMEKGITCEGTNSQANE